MQAWREAFSEGDARLLLSPDSEFFKYFRSLPAAGAPQPAAAQPAAPQ
jgi:membrane protease subunit HflC